MTRKTTTRTTKQNLDVVRTNAGKTQQAPEKVEKVEKVNKSKVFFF
jgi:hypothetical protein